MRARSRRRLRAGFSLVETMVATGVFAALLALALMSLTRNQRQVNESMVIASINQRANELEAKLQEHLRSAGSIRLVDTNADTRFDRIDYLQTTGYDFALGRAGFAANGRALRWINDGADGDKVANDGFLELINRGTGPLYTGTTRISMFGADCLWSVSQINFWAFNATSPSLGATPAGGINPDTELRITFTVRGVVGANRNGTLRTQDESRVVRISLRNLPPA